MAELKGGTTGQILSKTSATDMDFTWITPNPGDITAITATSPLTGGGTSGDVTIGILSGTTSNLGAVQLSTSTSSTSTSLAATASAVKSAYDLADAAIPKSLIDAAGDLIVGTAADTAGRLAMGTANQVLRVNSGGTALEYATPSGGGKVLQVVQATHSTEVSSSSTTYAATGLTVSITPTSATSKIYVHAIINGLTKDSGNANNAAQIRLLRNAATTIITSTGIGYTGTALSNQNQGNIQYLDSPATTSATTYDVYFANRSATATVYAQDGGANNQSVITVWEIGA
jgi:hypothetical protein